MLVSVEGIGKPRFHLEAGFFAIGVVNRPSVIAENSAIGDAK